MPQTCSVLYKGTDAGLVTVDPHLNLDQGPYIFFTLR